MKDWASVMAAMQVGVRRSVETESVALAPLAPALEKHSAEKRLLLSVGALDLMARAGAVARQAPAIEACPPEPKRVAWAAEAALLEALNSGPEDLLADWIGLAAGGGWVAPPSALAALLERNPARTPGLRDFVGVRGLWLAAQMERPEWTVEEEVDSSLDALELAPNEWDALDWREKARLLTAWPRPALAEHLDFLTRALNDRRKEVRAAAAELLLQIPESKLRQSLEALARERIGLETKALGKRLTVRPIEPSELPTGLPRTTGVSEFGPQALALADLVGSLPHDLWCEMLESTPTELVRYAEMSDDCEALFLGWTGARSRFKPSNDWAEALLRHAVHRPHSFLRPIHLFPYLSDEAIDAHVDVFVPEHNAYFDMQMLQRPGVLPPKLSARIVTVGQHTPWLPNEAIGHRLHPSVLPLLEEPWEQYEPRRLKWQSDLNLSLRLFRSLDTSVPPKP